MLSYIRSLLLSIAVLGLFAVVPAQAQDDWRRPYFSRPEAYHRYFWVTPRSPSMQLPAYGWQWGFFYAPIDQFSIPANRSYFIPSYPIDQFAFPANPNGAVPTFRPTFVNPGY